MAERTRVLLVEDDPNIVDLIRSNLAVRGFDTVVSTDGLRALTDYRRLMRRRTLDNERMPVIFNDFMKCLNADPTEEKSPSSAK